VIPPDEAGEVIGREATRLERLVQDLLDLARLRARRFSARDDVLDLGRVVGETSRRFGEKARALGIDLDIGADAALPAAGDHDRLLQVISNLVENALRVTPAGGRVGVTATGTAVVVEDTGPGIDPADLERAFERFHLHAKRAENRAVGTGLGLAIAHELTLAMGGTIAVHSELGRGTRFTVTLRPGSARAGVERAAVAGAADS
jgi:signal transduction histidine kinase